MIYQYNFQLYLFKSQYKIMIIAHKITSFNLTVNLVSHEICRVFLR